MLSEKRQSLPPAPISFLEKLPREVIILKNTKIFICKYCGIQFEAYNGNANKFCSRQCYWDSKKKKITKICVECGKEYKKPPSEYKSKFCSRECFDKYVGRNSIDAPCKTCGKIIHKWKSQIYKSGNIYCSRECSAAAIKKPGWQKNLRETPKYKLNQRIRGGIRKSIKRNKNGRHWEDLVGYTLEQLKKHLEKRFTKGMNWDKFFNGEIHIDHKIPISVFNFTEPDHEDFKRCWALKNLQPMWAEENWSKNDKLGKHFQPSLLF